VPRHAGGVTVGYHEPWRLGVDRFVAAVGAHHLFKGVPVWAVGVGTAMTLDLIAADGRHKGGVIVPAPALMVDTLLTRTSGIRRRARGGVSQAKGLLARSTRAAIRQGARFAAAALVDRAVAEAEELIGKRPFVVVTGGESAAVRSLLKSPAAGVPDLILKGLAVLAQQLPPPRARRR
jgi:type III pantothenate kinase